MIFFAGFAGNAFIILMLQGLRIINVYYEFQSQLLTV